MKRKMSHAMPAFSVFVLLGVVSLWATGNLHIGPLVFTSAVSHERAAADGCTDAACPDDHGTNDGWADAACLDDHAGHKHATAPTDIDAILKMNCEHVVLIADCDECRYEVGLVKIGPRVSQALLEIETLSERNMGGSLKLTGRIELDQTRVAEVAPAAAGRVVAIEKLLGQKVKAGDVLAVIQSAELGQAKADYLEAKARLELARTTFAREKQLYEKKITSHADFLTAESELRRSEAALSALEKRLNLFGLDAAQIAAVDEDRDNGHFAQLVVRAASDGTIIEQNVTLGKLVDSTETLYTVADLSSLWVWCDLYERDLAAIHARFAEGGGIKAGIRVAALPNKIFDGTLDLIDTKLNARTRTARVRLSVGNPDGVLKAGMFADARVAQNDGPMVTVAPKTAVMSDAGKSFVFQQIQDDLWLRRDVVTGREYDGYVEIVGSLPADARVVAKGAFMLKSDVLREKMGAGCAH
ncbi:MAG: efflux RND transporter periplasmic adaptor subunit [Phycisphaerae bacterium]|nr:efflux RND transporter periplasmic adaptor subunit [Phycisphaerae bacterium]